MSTTDSIIISISQIITAEVVYPMKPNATPNQINWFGRGVSLTVAVLALILGLTWKGSINILFALNEPFQMQVLPAFLLGLYAPTVFHPWSLTFGLVIGLVSTVVIEVMKTSNENLANFALRPGLSTFFLNCLSVFFIESFRFLQNWRKGMSATSSVQRESESLRAGNDNINQEQDEHDNDSFVDNPKGSPIAIGEQETNGGPYEAVGQVMPFPNLPAWDRPNVKRFGANSLTPSLLESMMSDTPELIKNLYYLGFVLIGITITTPLTPAFQPPLEGNEWIVLPVVVRGFPWWAFKALILLIISYLITVPMILSMPADFIIDEEKLFRSGINADAVELEPEEKGVRTQYDQDNPALSARRNLIRMQTERIITTNALAKEKVEDMKINDVGVKEAQVELGKLVSKRNLEVEPSTSKEFNKMLSDLPEEDNGIEN